MHERPSVVFLTFLRQGLISFGGPIAHLGYLRDEYVKRRGWVSDAEYADLVALCQFLPGPASSQVVFGLGLRRAGWLGAVLASLGFLLPSAILMIAFGAGAAWTTDSGWAHGLKLAAVAVVAHAVVGMAKNLLRGWLLWLLAAGVGFACLALQSPFAQVGALGVAALVAAGVRRSEIVDTVRVNLAWPTATRIAWGAWLGLLGGAFAIEALVPGTLLDLVGGMYRAGSLVFGGGHVVLPWLETLVVPEWMSRTTFMTGYGAAQAIPGPLFSFAGFVGSAAAGAWIGVACVLAIFVPAWLIVAGGLPWWERLRASAGLRSALAGVNAGVVGLLAATWLVSLAPVAARTLPDIAVATVGFVAIQWFRCPNWLLVGGCAIAGEVLSRFQ
ncbi:MAG: chromate efflux transporter [Opitutaceae bacterium]|nr:chromate efflux transporter [Opitutaceae bacterium]